jgi:ribosomal protein L24
MGDTSPQLEVRNGDRCVVASGTHKGKSGVVEDYRLSKTGHATVTVRQDNDVRFKTLARNVQRQS